LLLALHRDGHGEDQPDRAVAYFENTSRPR
jgi:hypothetical protein